MRRAAEVVTAVEKRALPRPLLVLPVGDALQEPFWPEGLGVNRGMHNAMDAAHVADRWGAAQHGGHGGGGAEACAEAARALVNLRQRLYEGKTLQMHGKNRSMLKGFRSDNSKGDAPKPAHSYMPRPDTRYNLKQGE